jgi:hypothetical protein
MRRREWSVQPRTKRLKEKKKETEWKKYLNLNLPPPPPHPLLLSLSSSVYGDELHPTRPFFFKSGCAMAKTK